MSELNDTILTGPQTTLSRMEGGENASEVLLPWITNVHSYTKVTAVHSDTNMDTNTVKRFNLVRSIQFLLERRVIKPQQAFPYIDKNKSLKRGLCEGGWVSEGIAKVLREGGIFNRTQEPPKRKTAKPNPSLD